MLALAAPPAPAQADREAEVVVLAYHAHPDPRAGREDADPFSSPRAPLPAQFRQGGEDAPRLPATRLDGVAQVSDAPEGDPASALAHFREAQRLLLLRQRTGAPVAVELRATPEPGVLRVDLVLAPAGDLGNASPALRLVVFEDPVPDPAGPRAHRFVVRHVATPEPLDLRKPGQLARDLPLDPSWDPTRVGVAAIVEHAGEPGRHARGEVLQAAAWRAGQEGPTVQVGKAVLVEAVTATWCDACRPTEESLALLASQFAASPLDQGPASYEARPGPLALGGLLAGAGVGVLLLRRRAA